ncbi:MAG: anti-sigma factor family protein [Acutalibacteraceae bacterium]
MTCDLDRVDALADGRLDGPEAKEVMEHLAGCPQCRAYYEAPWRRTGCWRIPASTLRRISLRGSERSGPGGSAVPGGGRTGRVPAAGGGGDSGAAPGGS